MISVTFFIAEYYEKLSSYLNFG